MNWILAEDLARDHLDALRRAAGEDRMIRSLREPHRVRRTIGTKIVRVGLALAAGMRAARSAPELVGSVICDGQVAGEAR